MKRWYNWPIIAGVVGGFIARDFCAGPILGIVFGIVIGIPLYYIFAFIFKIFNIRKRDLNHILGMALSCLVIIAFEWFAYNPSAVFLFKVKIVNPIPQSVNGIKAKSRYFGPDYSQYLKFNISKTDLEIIISEMELEEASNVVTQIENNIVLDLKSASGSFALSLPESISWFRLKQYENVRSYIKVSGEGCVREYLIYDPVSGEAIYEFMTL